MIFFVSSKEKIFFSSLLLFVSFFTTQQAFAATAGYGYLSLFGETVGNTSLCDSDETEFEFITKDFNAETAVVVNTITVSVREMFSGVITETVTTNNSSSSGPICASVSNSIFEVSVTGGSLYHNHLGAQSVSVSAAEWGGKHVRAHIHLAPITDTVPTVRPLQTDNLWYSEQPNLPLEVTRITNSHGATGLHSFRLFSNLLGMQNPIIVPDSPSAGTYSIPFPATLPEGWQFWGFYAGLNGGSPDPVSAWSGAASFGIDRTAPINIPEQNPVKISYATTDTLEIIATAIDPLSGVAWIRIEVDGILVRECLFADMGTQGSIEETCTSDTLGPYGSAGAGVTHTYTITSSDTAGNISTYDGSYTIQCTPNGSFAANTSQMQGCLYDIDSSTGFIDWSSRHGDAPKGQLLTSPVPDTATAMDINFGLASPITGENEAYGGVWRGKYEFNPGTYDFTLSADRYAFVFFHYEDATHEHKVSALNRTTTFTHEFTTTETVLIYVQFRQRTPATSDSFITFGWTPSECDGHAIGSNKFIGCLYKKSLYSEPFGPAPEGGEVSPLTGAADALNFNWGAGPMSPGLPVDNVSARWKGEFTLQAGTYAFYTGNERTINVLFKTDKENNVSCHNNTFLNAGVVTGVFYNWLPTAEDTNRLFYCTFDTDDTITIQIDFRKLEGETTKVNFGWIRQPGPVEFCDPTAVGVNQFVGCLYSNISVTYLGLVGALPSGPVVTDPANEPYVYSSESEATIPLDFNWGTGSPDLDFTGHDGWSAQWIGEFTFPAGTYEFNALRSGNSYTVVRFDGLVVAVTSPGTTPNVLSTAFQETFTEPTTILINLRFGDYSGNARTGFNWRRVPPNFDIAIVSPVGQFAYAHPGGQPIGSVGHENGYTVRVSSLSGYTGMVNVDADVPPGITKIGTWPKNCVLTAYGTCDVLLEMTTSSGPDPYQTYPIEFSARNVSNTITRSLNSTLKVWGFETMLTPSGRGVWPGVSADYDVSIRSINDWTGIVAVDADMPTAHPSITRILTPVSLLLLPNNSATSTLTISSQSTSPEEVYPFTVALDSTINGSSFSRNIGGIFEVTSVPYVLSLPAPTIDVRFDFSSSNTYKVLMNSTGAESCTFSRISSDGDEWSAVPVPDLHPNLLVSTTNFESEYDTYPDNHSATWTFTCVNAEGVSVTDSVTHETSAVPSSVNLLASGCVIAIGDSDCEGSIFWEFLNTTSASNRLVTNITTNAWESNSETSGPSLRRPLQRGLNIIRASADGLSTVERQVNADCDGVMSAWYEGVCVAAPDFTITADPRIIRRGQTTSVTISTDSPYLLTCDVYGAESVAKIDQNLATSTPIVIQPTKIINHKQLVTVTCTDTVATGLSRTRSAEIEIVPDLQEI